MITTVLFDMGNTLLDFHAQGPSDATKDAQGFEALMHAIRRQIDPSCRAITFWDAVMEPWQQYQQYHRHHELVEYPIVAAIGTFFQQRSMPLSEQQILQLLQVFYTPYAQHVIANQGARDCLIWLRQHTIHIGVVSNSVLPEAVLRPIFHKVQLAEYIDTFTFSYSYGHMKPHPGIFLYALSMAQAHAEQTLMVGDSLQADLAGAVALGMQSCYYNP